MEYKYSKYANLQYAKQAEIKSIQNRLFLEHFEYVVKNSLFYKKKYSSFGIDIKKVKTIEDISKLPFTRKKDLNKDLICVDKTQIVDICLTSGTSGAPTIVPLTKMDLQRLAFNEEIAFKTAGVTSKDTMLICAAIDKCFMAGIAYFLGGVNLNATMVRAGSNNSAQTWEMINITGATVNCRVCPHLYTK